MRRAAASMGAVLALGLAGSVPAVLAGQDDGAARSHNRADVRVAGSCTASTTATLKLSPEDGRVEVEFEVDQNRNGKRWSVVMVRNGTRVVSRTAVTRAPSGSFEVRAVIAAGSPNTRVTAVAKRSIPGGEVCRAVATLG